MSFIRTLFARIHGIVASLLARFPFLGRKLFYIPALIVLLGVGGYFAFGQPDAPQFETEIVARKDVLKVVSESGTIEPAREVDLAFTGVGRISRVYVEEGQTVRTGQLLAVLEGGREYADLLAARARLREAEANANLSGTTEEQTKAQQDQLVENARRELLSGGLEAYLLNGGSESSTRDFTAPVISGSYRCTREGTYRIELYASSAQSGATFIVSGLENDRRAVSTVGPVPLGTCGLYIQFPENFPRSRSIVWEVPVPNMRSSGYQARLSAYNAAVENRRLALEEGNRSPILMAQVAQARASLAAAEAAYADTRLVAPFTGIVTKVDAVRGDIASIGTPALSLISSEAFEIRLNVLEDDIGEVTIGDIADVSFDAYDGVVMPARVSFIAPAATSESGTAAFEVTLQFTEQDERIRAGLSVDVDIRAAEAKDVVAIPTRSVLEEDGMRYVRLMTSDTTYTRAPVTTGLSGNGVIEVTAGLSEGDRIITFANEEALATLTEE